jgi:hypothetical protein
MQPPEPLPDFSNAVAVLIRSKRIHADIWFAFDHSFITDDGKAIYYASELPILKICSQAKLNGIHKTKLVFPGSVVEK